MVFGKGDAVKQIWNQALHIWTAGKPKYIWPILAVILIAIGLVNYLVKSNRSYDLTGDMFHLSSMHANGGTPFIFIFVIGILYGQSRIKSRQFYWQLLPIPKKNLCLIFLLPVVLITFLYVMEWWAVCEWEEPDARVNLTWDKAAERELQMAKYKEQFPGASLVQVKTKDMKEAEFVAVLPHGRVGQVLVKLVIDLVVV